MEVDWLSSFKIYGLKTVWWVTETLAQKPGNPANLSPPSIYKCENMGTQDMSSIAYSVCD